MEDMTLTSTGPMVLDQSTIVKRAVADYISGEDMEKKDPDEARDEAVAAVQQAIDSENADGRRKEDFIPRLKGITPYIVAQLLLASGRVANLQMCNLKVPAIRIDTGIDEGLWKPILTKEDTRYLSKLARQYGPSLKISEVEEIKSFIHDESTMKVLKTTDNPDLVAVKNGVFDIKTGHLYDWADARAEEWVFTSKLAVDYNATAKDKIFHDDINNRDITSMDVLKEIAGDDEHLEALLASMHLMLRRGWSSDTAVLLVDPMLTGANGKSTICTILQEIIGQGGYACIPMSMMKQDFTLMPLLTSSAIINADADDNTYVSSSDLFKRIAGGDPIDVPVKFKEPVSGFRFMGHIFQCTNGFPRFNDVSDAIDRRFYMIDCCSHFKTKKNRDIKDRFMRDPEVLEYLLKVILEKRYSVLPEMPFQKRLKQEFRSETNPVDSFLDYITDKETREDGYSHWDGFYPTTWLFAAFAGYYYENFRKRSSYSTKKFGVSLRAWVEKHSDEWELPTDKNGKPMKVAHGGRMSCSEMFSEEFTSIEAGNQAEMNKWKNKNPIQGRNVYDPQCSWQPTELKPKYAALIRKKGVPVSEKEEKSRMWYGVDRATQVAEKAAVDAYAQQIREKDVDATDARKSAPVAAQAATEWVCECGEHVKGNFCGVCGKKKSDGVNPYANHDTIADLTTTDESEENRNY